jgi:membrane fusion protein (multidrug efflux system)
MSYREHRHPALAGDQESRLEQSPPRRSLRPFIILGVILTAIALGCVGYWWLNRDYITTDDAEIDGHVYTIAPQIAGRVVQVLVEDNAHVQTRQILVKLDPRDQSAALAKAEAGLAQAKAELGVAQAQVVQGAAQVTESEANLQQAQRDFDRFSKVNPRATTQQQVDAVTDTIQAAKAKSAAAAAALNGMQARVVSAQAQLLAANVAVQNAQLQLSYTEIAAPAAGHISIKTVQLGNVVAPGTAMMAVVGDPVWVTANYKETQLAGIRLGAPATIAVDAVPGVVFKAHVDSIQYGTGAVFSLLPAQNATGNYIKIVQRVPVKLVFDDTRIGKYLLAPGMSVTPSVVDRP